MLHLAIETCTFEWPWWHTEYRYRPWHLGGYLSKWRVESGDAVHTPPTALPGCLQYATITSRSALVCDARCRRCSHWKRLFSWTPLHILIQQHLTLPHPTPHTCTCTCCNLHIRSLTSVLSSSPSSPPSSLLHLTTLFPFCCHLDSTTANFAYTYNHICINPITTQDSWIPSQRKLSTCL